jgi:hypothetical protein
MMHNRIVAGRRGGILSKNNKREFCTTLVETYTPYTYARPDIR